MFCPPPHPNYFHTVPNLLLAKPSYLMDKHRSGIDLSARKQIHVSPKNINILNSTHQNSNSSWTDVQVSFKLQQIVPVTYRSGGAVGRHNQPLPRAQDWHGPGTADHLSHSNVPQHTHLYPPDRYWQHTPSARCSPVNTERMVFKQ